MFKKLLVGAVATPMLFAALSASAVTYSFTGINIDQENLSSQLSVDVTSGGEGLVSFKFMNNVGIASSITDIYFDNGASPYNITSLSVGTESAGVNFSTGANPANLPGGGSFLANFSADSDAQPGGVMTNGINASSEYLYLIGAGNLDSIIAGLTSGAFKIGLHVQAIGAQGGSDSYVTGPSAVPLPAAAWLFASGLGFFGVARRRLSK